MLGVTEADNVTQVGCQQTLFVSFYKTLPRRKIWDVVQNVNNDISQYLNHLEKKWRHPRTTNLSLKKKNVSVQSFACFCFCYFCISSITLLCPQKHIHFILECFSIFLFISVVSFSFCWVFFPTSVVFYSTYVVFCVLFQCFVAVHLTSQGHHRKFNSQDFISHLLTMKYMWVDIKRHLEMGEFTM